MKVEILTMDRKTITAYVDSYDAYAINEQLNGEDGRTIVIGDVIIDRSNVMRVLPIREETNA